ncbi:uncharacterized protein Z519_09035 [Cladophialophora bantiana CBS 173.52]|uniref:Fumarylacetoacetase-like C-terminal domain-containing protein n=1 Tax=Cladophialophora bantiana (strain ATCC 10958 / CBS 173.52 / CDC B-1940 / NIH 8579) TaxID=1442370 RepID=A0A0D2HHX3_CLAB1|nr:uncharacterized protein Z519_09035 [Cladophialophora bantiana CBS 173.52]KIW90390.1 hypothetical protein Z519_09035 [Cladophialophora bantiana CBS 173.52]
MPPWESLDNAIYAPPITQKTLDYEGELCVVLGRDAEDVSDGEALDYVLGYTAGNDVSARTFQAPELSGYQFSFAKSFDGFAPMGPCIATKVAIPDPQNISFVTRVNGAVRQWSNTSNMIFNGRQVVAHLSQGTPCAKDPSS